MAKMSQDMNLNLILPLRKEYIKLSKQVNTIVTTSRNSGLGLLEYFE